MALHQNSEYAADHEPASEQTQVQPIVRRQMPVQALEYHLFRPQRSRDALLEDAYEVWRNGWRDTMIELNGAADVSSDDFARQDEIAVVAERGRCIAVTGIRWLDLTLPRSREDSYFRRWPAAALAKVAGRPVCVASNTVVHPGWRGTRIEAPPGKPGEPVSLAFTTVSLSVRRFIDSRAHCLIALTRNDRAMDRFATALGATQLARVEIHGIATDVVCIEHVNARCQGPVVEELWLRRHQA